MRLTTRDIQMLSYLSDQGVATSSQIAEAFFPSRGAFFRRVCLLTAEGYVESLSPSQYAREVPSRLREIAEREAVSLSKLWRVRLYRLGKSLQNKKASFRPSDLTLPMYWQHQIALNDVRLSLKALLPNDGTLLADPDVRHEHSRFKFGADTPVPDLVWRRGDNEIAFEVERNDKGRDRYFERFAKYDRSPYRKIVYFANSDKLHRQLIDVARRFPKIAVARTTQPEKVYSHLRGYQSFVEFVEIES